MIFFFTNKLGQPVAYKVQLPGDAWIQKKKQKEITVLRSSCWARMGRIGGVEDVPELTDVLIKPTKDNLQTIGVKYVVKRNKQLFTGFGSSNEYSVIKKIDIYKNDGKPDKTVVTGNALHALEMATKRAKVAAIAIALGFDHNDVGEIVESIDFVINPGLRKIAPIGYKQKSIGELASLERANVIPAENVNNSPMQKETTPLANKPKPPENKPKSPTNKPKSPENKPKSPTNKPKPPENKSPVSPPNKSSDDSNVSAFIMPIGKYKGKALITILSEDVKYLEWAASNIDKSEISSKIQQLLKELPNLSGQSESSNPLSPPTSYRDMLKDFWKSRNYDPKTEVKDILEKALNETNLSYAAVSEEKAKSLYDQKETLFPAKGGKKEPVDDEDAIIKGLVGTAKCCVCSVELKEPEIKVARKKSKELDGRMMCYQHIRMTDENKEQPKEKCKKCKKVLDEQELQFIKEYDSAMLCENCQE